MKNGYKSDTNKCFKRALVKNVRLNKNADFVVKTVKFRLYTVLKYRKTDNTNAFRRLIKRTPGSNYRCSRS